jgi:c-di-GMP phosphodiesterase
MTEPNANAEERIKVSIGRQPVFDAQRKLWGYELFCVGDAASTRSGFPQEMNAAISVQSGAYLCLQQITGRGAKVIVDFTEKSILDNLPHALPPVHTAVKVQEGMCGKPFILEVLAGFKAEGYLIAVEGFSGNAAYEPLYDLADILSIEAEGCCRETLGTGWATRRRTSLMARNVKDPAQFRNCQNAGAALFHGGFFKAPEKITIRKMSSNEILRFNLLKFIEQSDPDLKRLAGTIQADATISFRLLSYLNSAAFTLTQKIKSIQQAITLLGWRNVRNWLRVVLLTDVSQSKDAHELVLLSAQRGMFLELVARDHDFWGFHPESLHLLGLFSLLDALLGMPMQEIVLNLPIDNKMKAALCGETNNEYSPLLRLARCLEETDWSESEILVQQLNLDEKKVNVAFQASINWASELDSRQSEKC